MWVDKIQALKKEKNAVILVHNYQSPEIYDVADFSGDSLELAKKAMSTTADRIVFCGVDFMAESAKILNPGKQVLLPALEARCPMAGMVNEDELRQLKARHPNAGVVCYINTYASTKALSDCCCTSANVVRVTQGVPFDEIIMVPDQNLAAYAQRFTDKKIIPIDGYCYVHHLKFDAAVLMNLKQQYPDAITLVHPECPSAIVDLADEVQSTSGMIRHVEQSAAQTFIVATEIGLINRMQRLFPEKQFMSANGSSATCVQMKKNTLELVYQALLHEQHQVEVAEDIRLKAKQSLDRMIEYS